MRSLAQVDEILGDPHRDPDNAQGLPHAPMLHVMLYHEFSLMDMILRNDRGTPGEEATQAFMSRVYQGGWYYRMEPNEFLITYLQFWYPFRYFKEPHEQAC